MLRSGSGGGTGACLPPPFAALENVSAVLQDREGVVGCSSVRCMSCSWWIEKVRCRTALLNARDVVGDYVVRNRHLFLSYSEAQNSEDPLIIVPIDGISRSIQGGPEITITGLALFSVAGGTSSIPGNEAMIKEPTSKVFWGACTTISDMDMSPRLSFSGTITA